jgi:hypothetical protein
VKGAAYEQGYADGYRSGVASLRAHVDSNTSIEAFIEWYDREFPGEHHFNSRPIEPVPVVSAEKSPVDCAQPWVEEPKVSVLQRFGCWLKWLLIEWKGI